MSILISPSDNRGWGAMMRRTRSCGPMRRRSSMRGTGARRRRRMRSLVNIPMTIRRLIGTGMRRVPRSTSRTTLVSVTTRRSRRRR